MGSEMCIRDSFETFAINTGLEGVFRIHTRSSDDINMFTQYGQLSDEIVDQWCQDLAQGVFISVQNNTRRAICEYDDTNLEWNGDALINSSTEAMKRTTEREITRPADRIGPRVLWCIIAKVLRDQLQ